MFTALVNVDSLLPRWKHCSDGGFSHKVLGVDVVQMSTSSPSKAVYSRDRVGQISEAPNGGARAFIFQDSGFGITISRLHSQPTGGPRRAPALMYALAVGNSGERGRQPPGHMPSRPRTVGAGALQGAF